MQDIISPTGDFFIFNVNCSTSQRVIIYKVPEQVGTLTYNGNIQVPIWDDYDPTKLLMIGEISGIDARTYTVTFLPIGNCTWSDDTKTPRNQTWKINRAVISNIPSQSGKLIYNGKAQSPVLNDFDAEQLTLSGDFENKLDAGTYTAYANATSNFIFGDNSTTQKFTWTIEKAAQIVSTSKDSLSLENILPQDTITVNRWGDGNISASSSDKNVVTVSTTGNEVHGSAVATGVATIKISVAEGKNYTAASVTLSVSVSWIKPLDECTPAEMLAAVKTGKAADAWDAGDLTAPITLNGKIGDALNLENFQVRAMLIGLNHNATLESNGKPSAHFILGTTLDGKNISLVDSNYNKASVSGVKYFQHSLTSRTNSGGWLESNLRKNICTDILNALPEEWRSVIAPCTKFTDNTGGGNDSNSVTPTADEIFLLSEFEVFGKKSYANDSEATYQAQYDYFRNGNSKVRFSHEDGETACSWWLRTAQNSNSTSFCRVHESGQENTYNAQYSQGVTPAFMIS